MSAPSTIRQSTNNLSTVEIPVASEKPGTVHCTLMSETVRPDGISLTGMEVMIEKLGADAFGPGRFTRAAFRLREGRKPESDLSFTAWIDDELVGSVRQTLISVGGQAALVLGPLVVVEKYKKSGVGSLLMRRAVEAAKAHGHRLIILVGDEPYYAKFGFKQVPPKQIVLPGPADPARILYCELQDGAIEACHGMAMQA